MPQFSSDPKANLALAAAALLGMYVVHGTDWPLAGKLTADATIVWAAGVASVVHGNPRILSGAQ